MQMGRRVFSSKPSDSGSWDSGQRFRASVQQYCILVQQPSAAPSPCTHTPDFYPFMCAVVLQGVQGRGLRVRLDGYGDSWTRRL